MSYGKSTEKKEPHISLELQQYFERATSTLSEIQDLQQANIFFQQINEDIKGKQILLAKHKTCSRFIDKYIKKCPNSSLRKLFQSFTGHFEELSTDRYASYNVENLVKETLQRLEAGDQESSFNELLASFLTELTQVSANLADDSSGSRVIRCIFDSLSKQSSLVTRIDKLARKIIQSFRDNPAKIRSTYFSATLQSMLSLDKERFGKLLNYLLSSVSFKFDDLSDKSTSKLIEELISNMGKSAITAIYEQTLTNRENLPSNSLGGAVECAFNPNANYVLQKWFEFCKDPEQLIIVINQLMPKVESLLGKRPQVVVAISKGLILTNQKMQRKFFDILVKQTDNGITERNFIDYFVYFKPPNGSKILQNICYFDKSIINNIIVEPLKKLGGEKTIEISLDLNGSYFISDFLKSENIDIKDRKKIIRRLLPKIGDLSIDKYGQHAVKNSFNLADIELKEQICKGIVDAASNNSTDFKDKAKSIWKIFRIDQFISRKNLWLKDTENIMKRQEAMSEIINDETIPDVKPLAPKVINIDAEIAESAQSPEERQTTEEIEQIGSLQKRRRKHRQHHQDIDHEAEEQNE